MGNARAPRTICGLLAIFALLTTTVIGYWTIR